MEPVGCRSFLSRPLGLTTDRLPRQLLVHLLDRVTLAPRSAIDPANLLPIWISVFIVSHLSLIPIINRNNNVLFKDGFGFDARFGFG